jgi:hypothetical protein
MKIWFCQALVYVPSAFLDFAFFINCIPYFGILICIYLNAYSYIEGPAKSAVPERKSLPVLTGKFCRSPPATRGLIHSRKEPIEVGSAQAPLLDFEEACCLKFFEIGAYAALSCPHILREPQLAWKTVVVVPCVFEHHRISELRSDRQFRTCQHDIRHHGEAMERHRIGTDDFDVARDLGDAVSDLFHSASIPRVTALGRRDVENERTDQCGASSVVSGSPSPDANGDFRNGPAPGPTPFCPEMLRRKSRAVKVSCASERPFA